MLFELEIQQQRHQQKYKLENKQATKAAYNCESNKFHLIENDLIICPKWGNMKAPIPTDITEPRRAHA